MLPYPITNFEIKKKNTMKESLNLMAFIRNIIYLKKRIQHM